MIQLKNSQGPLANNRFVEECLKDPKTKQANSEKIEEIEKHLSSYIKGKNLANYWTFNSLQERLIESFPVEEMRNFFKNFTFFHYYLTKQ